MRETEIKTSETLSFSE